LSGFVRFLLIFGKNIQQEIKTHTNAQPIASGFTCLYCTV